MSLRGNFWHRHSPFLHSHSFFFMLGPRAIFFRFRRDDATLSSWLYIASRVHFIIDFEIEMMPCYQYGDNVESRILSRFKSKVFKMKCMCILLFGSRGRCFLTPQTAWWYIVWVKSYVHLTLYCYSPVKHISRYCINKDFIINLMHFPNNMTWARLNQP